MDNLSNLGLKIRKLREFKNLSQEYLAKELKISQSQYSRLESGEGILKEPQLQKIAELLGMSINDIENFVPNGKMPVISNNRNVGIINKNKQINHYQIDPKLEKYYQDYIESLKDNISLLKDKIKLLEQKCKTLETAK